MLGELGGLKATLSIIGSLLVSTFVGRMFAAKIMKKIYHVRKMINEPLKKVKKGKKVASPSKRKTSDHDSL
jgi:hypothetical protein